MTSQSAAPTAKYVINARFEVNGLVEKPDVIGALFGQTEGLFGPELDLRELQKNNRIGRIEVEMKTEHNKTHGLITVSSSLSMASTSLLAAVIESVDRIGPREAKVWIEKIEDVREVKRKRIIKRAKDLLKKWTFEAMPETEELMKEIGEAMKPSEITTYGPEQLPAGPDIDKAPSVILVEGRADVNNLLRCGIKNAVAIQGARVSETVLKLGREKEITLFLDGDRAGDLILRELLETIHVKYVARAPPGKEVEELTCRDILTALKEKVPASDVKLKHARVSVAPKIIEAINSLKGTLEAILFNEKLEVLAQIPVSELAEKLPQTDGVTTVVFDGIITQRLVDVAAEKGIGYLIGDRVSELVKRPSNVRLLTFDDVAPESPAGPRNEQV